MDILGLILGGLGLWYGAPGVGLAAASAASILAAQKAAKLAELEAEKRSRLVGIADVDTFSKHPYKIRWMR